ncbi:unnamed protein product [Nezara viridula]|uniref:Uncharacterized protein n=1 Tax=Nezara viridula TaxID=85310 RepID=A0A9P0HMI7_NEZVI|nr:unnamed protein product [Nezara viridula]
MSSAKHSRGSSRTSDYEEPTCLINDLVSLQGTVILLLGLIAIAMAHHGYYVAKSYYKPYEHHHGYEHYHGGHHGYEHGHHGHHYH